MNLFSFCPFAPFLKKIFLDSISDNILYFCTETQFLYPKM